MRRIMLFIEIILFVLEILIIMFSLDGINQRDWKHDHNVYEILQCILPVGMTVIGSVLAVIIANIFNWVAAFAVVDLMCALVIAIERLIIYRLKNNIPW